MQIIRHPGTFRHLKSKSRTCGEPLSRLKYALPSELSYPILAKKKRERKDSSPMFIGSKPRRIERKKDTSPMLIGNTPKKKRKEKIQAQCLLAAHQRREERYRPNYYWRYPYKIHNSAMHSSWRPDPLPSRRSENFPQVPPVAFQSFVQKWFEKHLWSDILAWYWHINSHQKSSSTPPSLLHRSYTIISSTNQVEMCRAGLELRT